MRSEFHSALRVRLRSTPILLASFGDHAGSKTTGDYLKECDACHLQSIASGGGNESTNGISLRRDLHALFDNDLMRFNDNRQVIMVTRNDHYQEFTI